MANEEASQNPAKPGPSPGELCVLQQAAPRYSAATSVQRAQILQNTTVLLRQTSPAWTKRSVRQWFAANAAAVQPPALPVQIPVIFSPYQPSFVPPLPPGLMAPYAPFVQLPQCAPSMAPGVFFSPMALPLMQTVAAPSARPADDEEEEDAPPAPGPARAGIPMMVPLQVPAGLLGIPQASPALMAFPGAFGGTPMQQPFPFIIQPAPALSYPQIPPPPGRK
jgi:hypothetical protein